MISEGTAEVRIVTPSRHVHRGFIDRRGVLYTAEGCNLDQTARERLIGLGTPEWDDFQKEQGDDAADGACDRCFGLRAEAPK